MSEFYKLTAGDIADLNAKAAEQIEMSVQWLSPADWVELLGIRDVTDSPGEPYQFRFGKRSYAMDRSKTNRPIRMDAVRFLMGIMAQGKYCLNGETCIWGDDEMAISAQHRGVAHYLQGQTVPTLKLPYIVVTGVPHQFADTADTGRSRTNSDILNRQADVFDESELVNIMGNSYGAESRKVRAKLVKDYASATRLIHLRTKGKDISGSGKFTAGDLFVIADKCPEMEQLISEVYAEDTGTNDTASFSSMFPRPMVATALLLWSNRDYDGDGPWAVDFGMVKAFCEALRSSTTAGGPFSELFVKLSEKKKAKSRMARQYWMGTLVNMLNLFAEYYSELSEGETVGTLPSDGLIPRESKDAKQYPHFGGLDIGYQPTKRGAKSEENEEAAVA